MQSKDQRQITEELIRSRSGREWDLSFHGPARCDKGDLRFPLKNCHFEAMYTPEV